MADIIKFQHQLLTDAAERKKFAEDPASYLKTAGIAVPAGVKLPQKLSLPDLEKSVEDVQQKLKKDRLDTATIGESSPAEFARFVGDAVPLRTKDIAGVVGARQQFGSKATGGDAATAAAVAVAVVAAVVAVPVAVFGKGSELEQFARPELGITGVTAGRVGLTLHGPEGLTAEGLTADDVARVIKNLRTPE